MHGASPQIRQPECESLAQQHDSAAPEKLRPDGRYDGRHADIRDQKAVQRPIPKPIRMATMTPSQTCPVCIAVSAKPNPATASVEGKHKSISPAATTNVKPERQKTVQGQG